MTLEITPLVRESFGDITIAVVSWVNGLIPLTNRANGQAHGSSFVRNMEQEFVIGGYIPGSPRIRRIARRRLQKQELMFAAKVKNGFVPRIRDEIFPGLKTLQTTQCPFKNLPEKRASRWGESLTAEKMDQCRWVKPKLVCQVAFVEWTDAGHLRHCTFVAMRDDKKTGGGGSRNLSISSWRRDAAFSVEAG